MWDPARNNKEEIERRRIPLSKDRCFCSIIAIAGTGEVSHFQWKLLMLFYASNENLVIVYASFMILGLCTIVYASRDNYLDVSSYDPKS